MIATRGVGFEYAFQGPQGGTPTIRIANIPFGTGYQLAETSSGIIEEPAGSGCYFLSVNALGTAGTYAIILKTTSGTANLYGAEDLIVSEDGEDPGYAPAGNAKLLLDTAGNTGLVGTLGIQFINTPGTAVLTARTTVGITEESGTGVYAWSGALPDIEDQISAIWDTGGDTPDYAIEELVLTPDGGSSDTVVATSLITRVAFDGYTLFDASQQDASVTLLSEMLPTLLTSAKPREEMESRVDDDGGIDVTQFYEPRVFDPFSGRIRASDFSEFITLHNRLNELFSLGGLHELVWTLGDGSSRKSLVRVNSEWACNLDSAGRPFAHWSVMLVAPDPLVVSATTKSMTLDPFATNTDGLQFPLGFPLHLGGSSNSITVTNEGTRAARATYTFQGPWDAPFVENATTGVRIYTNGLSLAAGEYAVIDTRTRTFSARGNDAPDLIDWERSSGPWPILARGANLVRAGGSPSSGALLQIDYADTFI